MRIVFSFLMVNPYLLRHLMQMSTILKVRETETKKQLFCLLNRKQTMKIIFPGRVQNWKGGHLSSWEVWYICR